MVLPKLPFFRTGQWSGLDLRTINSCLGVELIREAASAEAGE